MNKTGKAKKRNKLMRGKNGKFMRDWRGDLVESMAARSRANIERANEKGKTLVQLAREGKL